MSDWLWVWLGAMAFFAFLEVILPLLFVAASFSAGAALAAGIAALDGSVVVQWIAFLVVSFGLLAVLEPLGRRLANARDPDAEAPEGATRWIGRVAVVLEEIPPGPHDTGLVRLERAPWRAETNGEYPIAPGTAVEVLAVRGTRLVVEPYHEQSAPSEQENP
jgi:membrane protein implicated in regulation of membrane protease activity